MTTEPRDELMGRFDLAWALNEALCDVFVSGTNESREIAAKAVTHPKVVAVQATINARIEQDAKRIAELERERDHYLSNWQEARAYTSIETNHAAQAESRAEAAERALAEAREDRRRWQEASVRDRAALHAETEACAQVALVQAKQGATAEQIADAIRARSKT